MKLYFSVQVQPDVEDLDPSLLGEGKEEKPEEKLGKLQYSLDYDFQNGQVCAKCFYSMAC